MTTENKEIVSIDGKDYIIEDMTERTTVYSYSTKKYKFKTKY